MRLGPGAFCRLNCESDRHMICTACSADVNTCTYAFCIYREGGVDVLHVLEDFGLCPDMTAPTPEWLDDSFNAAKHLVGECMNAIAVGNVQLKTRAAK